MPDRRTTARFRRRFKGITSATRPRTLAPHLRLVAAANVATLVVGLFAVSAPLRGAAAAGDCPAVGFSPGSGLASLSDADLARDLDEMLAVGAEWLRMDFSWASVEDTRGSYHWAAIDRVVNAATSRGIKVIGLLAYTPDWARAAGSDSIMYPPIDPSTFATFARAAVQRYSSRVKVWEVWNEPNITPFWRPRPDPVTYTNLLKPAYAAIKAADPEATVLAAGLSPAIDAADGAEVSPATFLRAIYDAGGGGSFDAVSMHPYSYPARPIDPSTAHWNTFHRLPLVYDVMVANGDGHKSIWLTEFGAPTGTNATAVSEAEQAAIITDAVNAFPQFPWAKNLLVYANRDAGTDAADREHNFGVVRRDFSPKAARDALRQAATTCGATQPTTVSIGDATVREGNSGFSTATFAISRSGSTELEATVEYRTAAGTAAGGNDFVEVPSASVSFAPGETTKEVTVTVRGDTEPEGVETFSVNLSAPTGATLSDDAGTARILEDDLFPSLSIDDVTVPEGPLGTSVATFTITRSGNTAGSSSVRYGIEGGTALLGTDILTVPLTTVTFAPGETAKPVAVTVKGDGLPQSAKTFSLRLSSPVGATISDDTGVGTIANDDSGEPTSVRVSDVTVTEGNSGSVPATFTLTRSGDTSGTSSVQYLSNSATAAGAVDYVRVPQATATFAPGETTKTVTAGVIGDTVAEGNETFVLNLSAPVGAALTDSQGVATIVDDEAVIVPGPSTFLAASDVTVTEGSLGTAAATFTISRSGVAGGTSSVRYSVSAGTATADVDYTVAAPGTVTFAAGETTKTVTVGVVGDLAVESNETFFLELSSPVGASIADAQGVAVVVDDDSLLGLGTVPGPATFIAINDVSVLEGGSGGAAVTFSIIRSGSTNVTSSVVYATASGTAMAGSDYASLLPATATFGPGETVKTVTVPVNDDTVDEPNETLSVDLSVPVNATVSDAQGVATIVDDDGAPGPSTFLHVTDTFATEANAGTRAAVFMINRSGDTSGTSSVQFATTGAGTATAGSDYVAVPPTTVTFAAGETAKTAAVTVNGDGEGEPDESFFVRLTSPAGAVVSDDVGNGTVTDDDARPALSVTDVTVVEGDSGTAAAVFTITRSGSTAAGSSVQYGTAPASATSGADFAPVPLATATFAPGEATKTVTVGVNGDLEGEEDESFRLNLSAPAGATLADGAGIGTITNDDALSTVGVNDVTVLEAQGGAWAVFSLSRAGDAAGTSTVQYATAPGTATDGSDYVGLATGKMTFGPGERTKIAPVRVNADSVTEEDETFFLKLSLPTGAVIADAQGTATIRTPSGGSTTATTAGTTPTTASPTTTAGAASTTTTAAPSTTTTTAAPSTTTTTAVPTPTPVTAAFIHPLEGAQAVDLSKPFSWTAVPDVEAYHLYVGTTRGASDVDQSGETRATSFTPRQLPAGRTLWGRIWTKRNGAWTFSDVSFTTSATLAPTTASFVYPTEGAQGVNLSRPFSWTAVPDVQAYYLYIGTTRGASDVDQSGEIQATSYTPKKLLPARTLWGRIWTKRNGAWTFSDVSFSTAATAMFLHPLEGSRGVDLSKPFSWTAVPDVQAYYLYVGTTRGASDVDQSGEIQAASYTPKKLLPARTLWGRIWTKRNGAWTFSDVSFTTSASLTRTVADFVYPTEGAQGVNLSKPFSWTAVPGVQAYYLYVGTTRGAADVDQSGEIQATSYTPKKLLPARTLWGRIWTKRNGAWTYSDVSFTTAATF